MLSAIHHVAIICADYHRAKIFYTEILGLEVLAEQYRSERQSFKLDLKLPGGGQLELFSFPSAPKRLTEPEACGLRHLAFMVDSVEEARTALIEKGVEVEPIRVDELTGKAFTFFRDPDGLPLELYQR